MTIYADTARLRADLLDALPPGPDLEAVLTVLRQHKGIRAPKGFAAAQDEIAGHLDRMREVAAGWLAEARAADAVALLPEAEPGRPKRIGLAGYIEGLPGITPDLSEADFRGRLRIWHILPLLDGAGTPLPPTVRALAEMERTGITEIVPPSRQVTPRRWPMTGADLREARRKLGERIGLARPIYCSEIGAALDLSGRDVGESVVKWEKKDGPTGPAAAAIRAWLRETEEGRIPPELAEAVGLEDASDRGAA